MRRISLCTVILLLVIATAHSQILCTDPKTEYDTCMASGKPIQECTQEVCGPDADNTAGYPCRCNPDYVQALTKYYRCTGLYGKCLRTYEVYCGTESDKPDKSKTPLFENGKDACCFNQVPIDVNTRTGEPADYDSFRCSWIAIGMMAHLLKVPGTDYYRWSYADCYYTGSTDSATVDKPAGECFSRTDIGCLGASSCNRGASKWCLRGYNWDAGSRSCVCNQGKGFYLYYSSPTDPTPDCLASKKIINIPFSSVNHSFLLPGEEGEIKFFGDQGQLIPDSEEVQINAMISPCLKYKDRTLMYNPLCQMCGKHFYSVRLMPGPDPPAMHLFDFSIPCEANVTLISNSNFVKKDVIESAFAGRSIHNLADAFKSTSPVYDSILLDYADALALDNLSVRYVEIDSDDAKKTFDYGVDRINILPGKTSTGGVEIHAPKPGPDPEHAYVRDTLLLGQTKITYVISHNTPGKPAKMAVTALAPNSMGKEIVFFDRLPRTGSIKGVVTFEIAELPDYYKITFSLPNAYESYYSLDDFYKARADEYNAAIKSMTQKIQPHYLILFGDHDAIPAPIVNYDVVTDSRKPPVRLSHPADSCFAMDQCAWGHEPTMVVARLPNKAGDDGVLTFKTISESIARRSALKEKKIDLAKTYSLHAQDLYSAYGPDITQALYRKDCASQGFPCAFSPPICDESNNAGLAQDIPKCSGYLEMMKYIQPDSFLHLGLHGNNEGCFANNVTYREEIDTTTGQVAKKRVVTGYGVFKNNEMMAMLNNRAPDIITSIQCTGASLTRPLLDRIPNRDNGASTLWLEEGALAYTGRYVPSILPSRFEGGFYEGLTQGLTIGDAFYRSRMNIVKEEQSSATKSYLRLMLSEHLYGDPTLHFKQST